MEKIIEKKSCKKCSVNFDITDKDLEFFNKISPIFEGKKYEIPSPSFCPDCRQQRRLSFRNERKLYKRKCDSSGENIISIYSPDKNIKVYEQKKYYGDSWSALDYGFDIDFDKTFLNQFSYLFKKVPQVNLYQLNCENSYYINACSSCGNCYMIFNSDGSEKVLYSDTARNCVNSIDTGFCDKCENSYELLECGKCFNVFYGFKTSRCSDSYFLYNCKNSKNCFLCSNLENKQYYILNKKYSKDEYFSKKEKLLELGFEKLKIKFNFFIKKSIKNYMTGYSNENSSGDNIFFTKNCSNSYDSNNIEDCKNCNILTYAKDCMDYQIFGGNSTLIYDSIAVGSNSNKIIHSLYCFDSNNLFYCYGVGNSNNCFLCIGLKNKQYCILNKQYTKQEYNKLVPKIIEHMKKTGEWGEFFPSIISPFGYNETVAQEYFPLEKEDIINQNFNYSDYELPFPKVEKIIPAVKLPENIEDIPDDILNWAIKCEVSGKPFRIIKQELEFYRKHNLPIPRKHPDQRHLERMKLRNSRKLYNRKCDMCGKDIKTTYSNELNENIYCQECYNKEIY